MKAKKTALILTLRLRFLVVKTMRVGAAKIIIKATSWSGEKVSPKKNQPRIRYKTGASCMKMPRLVESSISRAL